MEIEQFFYDYRDYFDTFVWLDKEFKKKFCQKQKKDAEKDFSLLSRFIDFKQGFQEEQKKALEAYKLDISSKIGGNWQVDPKRVLYIYLKEDAPRIGIECVFEDETYEYPLGKLHIYIASWDKSTFGSYTGELKKAYPDSHIYSKFKNRLFLPVAAITPENNKDIIINKLAETYKKLKEIRDSRK